MSLIMARYLGKLSTAECASGNAPQEEEWERSGALGSDMLKSCLSMLVKAEKQWLHWQ